MELHEDESLVGVLHPEAIVLAPDAYIADFSYGTVEDCGKCTPLALSKA